MRRQAAGRQAAFRLDALPLQVPLGDRRVDRLLEAADANEGLALAQIHEGPLDIAIAGRSDAELLAHPFRELRPEMKLLEIAGGVNIFAAVGRESVQPAIEQLIASAPEVILDVHGTQEPDAATIKEDYAAWARLTTIPAVPKLPAGTVAEIVVLLVTV